MEVNPKQNKDEIEGDKPLFPLGKWVCTLGAARALKDADQDPIELLRRHVTGDWGDLPEEDRVQNNLAVEQGLAIVSAYNLETGATIWVTTTSDRRTTTLMTIDVIERDEAITQ